MQTKLGELSQEQAANKDNFDKVLQLEDEKIALLKAAGSKYTAQYYAELTKRENMVREHNAHVTQMTEQALGEQRSLMEQAIAQRKDELDVEVALHTMSKQQEIAQLRSFTNEQHALWLQGAEQFKSTLDTQSDAYKKFTQQLETTQAKWVTDSKKLDVEAAQDMEQSMDKAISPIESAFYSSISGVIQGTQTLQQALGKMAELIAESYIKEAAKAALHWILAHTVMKVFAASSETAQTAAAATGAAARSGIRATSSASENVGIVTRIARWMFGETAKTAATATGA